MACIEHDSPIVPHVDFFHQVSSVLSHDLADLQICGLGFHADLNPDINDAACPLKEDRLLVSACSNLLVHSGIGLIVAHPMSSM
jgi:hypothetical protein